MTPLQVTLSTGRTVQQGEGSEKGKYTDSYFKAAATLSMDPDDMKKIGVQISDKVKLKTESGKVTLRVNKSQDAPHPGIVFLPYGPWANILIGDNTDSQGMPDYKNVPAEVEKTSEALVKLEELISEEKSD